jgi:hypothetical protein
MKRLSIIFVLFIIGCGGTRNTNNEKAEKIEIKNTYSNGSKIVLSTNLIYEPIDVLKPFKIEGKTYQNVKITNSKVETKIKWNTKTIYRTKTIYKTKIIERKDNTLLWIGVAFIVCGFVFLYFYLPKIKKPLFK